MRITAAFVAGGISCSATLACTKDAEESARPDAGQSDATSDAAFDSSADVSSDSPERDVGVGADTGIRPDAGADAPSSADAADATDGDGAVTSPGTWLAYIADPTAGVDELWAARVTAESVAAPVRVNAPLLPDEDVTWMHWTNDGTQLAYRVGADESTLFVADMTGAAPGSPRRLDGVGRLPTWSPNGRYLAYLTDVSDPPDGIADSASVVDLSEPTLTARSAPFCPDHQCEVDGGNFVYFDNPPHEFWEWSGDSEWLYGLGFGETIWAVRVQNGGPNPPRVIDRYSYTLDVLAIHPRPFGAAAAVNVHRKTSGFRSYLVVIATEPGSRGGGTSMAPYTLFDRWLPNGEFVFFGTLPGGTEDEADTYFYNAGQRVFDITEPRVGWKLAPDTQTLALVVDDANPSEAALYLRRFDSVLTSPWDPPVLQWGASRLAIADFSKSYEWSHDSRYLLYAKSSLFVLDTGTTPLLPPHEFDGSIPAGASASSIAWGAVSNRIFYTTSNVLDLEYIDFRDGTMRSPAVVTPAYAHAAGDAVVWRLSADDGQVASSSDFTHDGVAELYVTSVAGSAPGAPQRVHPALTNGQGVKSFAWQPAFLP